MSSSPPTPMPVDVVMGRLLDVEIRESTRQTSYAIIGALEQHGWVIVRKRNMRLPK